MNSNAPNQDERPIHRIVVRYRKDVVATRDVPRSTAVSTVLREWITSEEWVGLTVGMTITVEEIDREQS